MARVQKTVRDFVKLGTQYLDLSQKYYGKNTRYVNDKKNTFTSDYEFDHIRLYFAGNTDHRSFKYKEFDISYFSTPVITIDFNKIDKLSTLYFEALTLFGKLKRKMAKVNKSEIKAERNQKIKDLQKEIKVLKGLK